MKFLLLILLVGSPLVSGGSLNAACFPENTKWLPVNSNRSHFSKAEFDDAIKIVHDAYTGDVEKAGGHLVFKNLWNDGTVNSDTYRDGDTWYVDAYGGLARYPDMTKAAYIAVLCHEVGHNLGGDPRYNNNTDWAAVEGQADYWATLECMRRVDPSESLAASQTLANVLAELGGEPMPNISTPDPTVVDVTFEDHPAAQCRLDTYYRGIQQTDRPRCWYAPAKVN